LRPLPTSSLFPYTTLFRSRLARKTGGEKWTRIVRAVLLDAARNHGSGIRFLECQFDVWICFIIAQQDVVLRLVLLDNVVFKRERDRKSTRLNSSHQIISYA